MYMKYIANIIKFMGAPIISCALPSCVFSKPLTVFLYHLLKKKTKRS